MCLYYDPPVITSQLIFISGTLSKEHSRMCLKEFF